MEEWVNGTEADEQNIEDVRWVTISSDGTDGVSGKVGFNY